MDKTTETYPDKIRKIAMDITLVKHFMELEMQATRLREIADALEELLKQEQLETT
jgi:hypothetical protein